MAVCNAHCVSWLSHSSTNTTFLSKATDYFSHMLLQRWEAKIGRKDIIITGSPLFLKWQNYTRKQNKDVFTAERTTYYVTKVYAIVAYVILLFMERYHSAYLGWWEPSYPSAVTGGVICIRLIHNRTFAALHIPVTFLFRYLQSYFDT